MKLIEINLHQIFDLCKKYKVKKLYLFGSILTDKFNDKSDVDFSIEFDKDEITKSKLDWANVFFDFMHEMESLLGRKVDIVFDNHITNKLFRMELDNTKRLIYG
ncbi:MAG: nucleotidyltransferase domain-containing protein [Bacteroides sp.]|nr:nucleotidyltransferase domain-containing protein [Bacteroidales bacterium]MBD5304478.1 nucleotidyltransferase domain-containing protein [Bacteroides sp.]MBD5340738.1 nucleotidyltransferase domain-containing protein [Bacteroides sp.]